MIDRFKVRLARLFALIVLVFSAYVAIATVFKVVARVLG